MTVAMSVSVQLTAGIWRAVGWKNDKLMGNGWADAWMDGLMGGWDSSFILGSKEAMYILHWKFLGSNIYLPDTGPRGGYPCTEGPHTEISKKPGPSHGDIQCALCLTGGCGDSWRRWWCKRSVPKAVQLELNLEKTARSRKGVPGREGPAGAQQSQETPGQKIDTSTVFCWDRNTEEWRRWGWKVRQESKVDLPCLHTSALSLRKSDELIRQVLKVSKAEWLGTLKWINELLPRNLVWHKSIFFFPRVALFPSGVSDSTSSSDSESQADRRPLNTWGCPSGPSVRLQGC